MQSSAKIVVNKFRNSLARLASISTGFATTTYAYAETSYANPVRGLALVNGGGVVGDRIEFINCAGLAAGCLV